LRARLARNIDKVRRSTMGGLIRRNFVDPAGRHRDKDFPQTDRDSHRDDRNSHWGTRTAAIRKGTPAERIRIYVVGIQRSNERFSLRLTVLCHVSTKIAREESYRLEPCLIIRQQTWSARSTIGRRALIGQENGVMA